MAIAVGIANQINGYLTMSNNVKTLFSPGLVNLLVLEVIFLLLALWISLCLWTGVFVNVGHCVAGLAAGWLLVSMLRQRQ